MQKLYRVLYCSRPAIAARPAERADVIRNILAAARRRNAADGITGGLMFSKGCFAQVLEGPMDAVSETFERIQQDERHFEVTVLQAAPIATRDFPAWSMAYTGADHADDPTSGLGAGFAGHASGGQDLLDLLRAVIVHEDDRLQMN